MVEQNIKQRIVVTSVKMRYDMIFTKNLYKKYSKKNTPIRLLSLAAFAGLSLFGTATYAAEENSNHSYESDIEILNYKNYSANSTTITPNKIKGSVTGYAVPASPLGSDSLYTITEVSASGGNNIITVPEVNSSGQVVNKYYRVDLKQSTYGSGSNIKYYKWAKLANGLQLVPTTNAAEANLTLKYNSAISEITVPAGSLRALIEGNYLAQSIKNSIAAKGTITNVKANFISDTVSVTSSDDYHHTAILVETGGKITDVKSSFIGNTISTTGKEMSGALIKSIGEVTTVDSEFLGNNVSGNSNILGGLISTTSTGKIGAINSQFIGNNVESQNNITVNGGVLYNSGTVGSVSSSFINNSISTGGNASGSSISNVGTITGNIQNSLFEGNVTQSTASGAAKGGAIYNDGIIQGVIKNTSFIGNAAISASGSALGGAIYSNTDISIAAENATVEFSGNYVQTGGTKTMNDIFIDSRIANLNIDARNNGKAIFRDGIDGLGGYNINFTGDATGLVGIYGGLANADVNVNNVTLDFQNNKNDNFNFVTLTSGNNAKYKLDINFSTEKSDTFTTGTGSSGTIYIDSLNRSGDLPWDTTTIRLLTADNNDRIKIAVNSAVLSAYNLTRTKDVTWTDNIENTYGWGDTITGYRRTDSYASTLSVSSTSGVNDDSLLFRVIKTEGTAIPSVAGDTLKLLAQNVTTSARNFVADKDRNTYTLSTDIGSVSAGTLNITGVRDTTAQRIKTSTLNANSKILFVLDKATNLTLKDIILTNLKDAEGSLLNITNSGASATLESVAIPALPSGVAGIVNNGSLTLSSYTTLSTPIKGSGNTYILAGGTGFPYNVKVSAPVTQNKFIITNGRVDVGAKIDAYITNNGGSLVGNGQWFVKPIVNNSGIEPSGTWNVSVTGSGTMGSWSTTQVVFNAIMQQSNYSVGLGGRLTISADNLHSPVSLNSGSLLYLGAGTLLSGYNISGGNAYDSRAVTLTGNVTNNANISSSIYIPSGLSFTESNASHLGLTAGAYVNNAGTFNVLSGDLGRIIIGSGTTNINGNVTMKNIASNALTNANTINVASGKTFTVENVSNLTGSAAINNAGIMAMQSGTLSRVVSGTGSTNITGSVISNAAIQQAISIASGASLQIAPSNIQVGTGRTITNNGNLIISSSGTIANTISGSGSVTINNGTNTVFDAPVNQNVHGLGAVITFTKAEYIGGNISEYGESPVYIGSGTVDGKTLATNRTYTSAGSTITFKNTRIGGTLQVGANSTVYADSSIGGGGYITVEGANANLYYTGGELYKSIYSGSGSGLFHVAGNVSFNGEGYEIRSRLQVDPVGSFTSKIDFLHWDVINQGKLYTYGTLDKTITGSGTTYINPAQGELAFANGAAIAGTLNLNSGVLNVIDQAVNSYSIGSLAGTGTAKIDVDVATNKSDMFVLSSASNGIITPIFNFMNVTGAFSNKKFQIIDGGKGGSINLGGSSQTVNYTNRSEDFVTSPNVTFGQTYAIRDTVGTATANLSLATTDSANDSVNVSLSNIRQTGVNTTQKDLYRDWMLSDIYDSNNTKTYNFRTATDVTVLSQEFAKDISGKTVNINGVVSGDNYSTINQNSQYGHIAVGNGGSLNIKNVKYTGMGYGTSNSGTYNFYVYGNGKANFDNIFYTGNGNGGAAKFYFAGSSIIDNITGTLSSNSAGMLIYNVATINRIAATIRYNTSMWSGVLTNYGTIKTIENSTFRDNPYGMSASYNGLAVRNYGTIETLQNTEFTNNYFSGNGAYHPTSPAIYNASTIGTFLNNKINSNYINVGGSNFGYGLGGAIYNASTFTNGIVGTKSGSAWNAQFSGNRITAFGGRGGALYNAGNLKTIDTVLFDGNYINYKPAPELFAQGGAIYNTGNITNGIVNSNFSNNYIKSEVSTVVNAVKGIQGGAIFAASNIPIISNTTFTGNYLDSAEGTAYGGAIYGNVSQYVNTTFTNNSAQTSSTNDQRAYGGAIYSTSPITSISGTFIGNSVQAKKAGAYAISGAIHGSNIGTIDATFDGNFAKSVSGAIGGVTWANNITEIKSSSVFKNNYAEGSGEVSAGAIHVRGATVDKIGGTFTGNYVLNHSGSAQGGAIWNANSPGNSSVIKNITANFSGNHTDAENGTSMGGAIYNTKVINSITGNYDGNYAYSKNNAAYGGAIYNSGDYVNRTSLGEIVNSSFTNNYAAGTSAYGGAIYDSDTLTITAKDGYQSKISGNYVTTNGGTTKDYQAIYLSGNSALSANLYLNTKTNGSFVIDDYITGNGVAAGSVSYQNVNITGDGTGKIYLNNDIRYSNVSISNTTLVVGGNTKDNYNFHKLISADTAKYIIGVNLSDNAHDMFTVGRDSSGVIAIDDIVINGSSSTNKVFQIINAQATDNIQLKLSKTKYGSYNVVDNILRAVSDSVKTTDRITQAAGITLTNTNTLNDSIAFNTASTFDTLYAIAQKETANARSFNFVSNNETFTLSTNLTPVTAGSLSINGRTGAILNANSHSLFTLDNETALNLNNVKIQNSAGDPITVNNAYATVNLNNADIQGNITGNKIFKMEITNGAHISGNITNANATLNSGELFVGTNTFAAANDKLTVFNGGLNLKNSRIETTVINNLESSSNGRYQLDMNLLNKTIDNIKLNSSASTGVINIADINFMNNLTIDEYGEYLVKVLQSPTSNIKLSLSDEILAKTFNLGDIRRDGELDTIKATTKFDEVYYTYYRLGQMAGKLSTGTTTTTDDSLKISVVQDWSPNRTPVQSMGDTLKLVAQANLNARTFEASSANEYYTSTDDVGNVSKGELIIAGVSDDTSSSTINLANHQGFVLGKDTSLSLNNVNLIGNENLVEVTDSSAKIELNNTYLEGNIVGDARYNLSITGNGMTTVNGTLTGANATISKGGLAFKDSTFAGENTTLNLNGGHISLDDNVLSNYVFNELIAGASATWGLDVDLNNSKADFINVKSGSGTITIESLNVIGLITNPGASYTIKVLNNNGNNIKLALADIVSPSLGIYKIGENTKIEKEVINPITAWNKIYYQDVTKSDIIGYLNIIGDDSLKINVSSISPGVTERVIQGDTLKVLSQYETDSPKQFQFDAANNIYTVSQNIGSVVGKSLTVNGVVSGTNRSTINANYHTLFTLDDETVLNLNNIGIANAINTVGSVINITNSSAKANINNVFIGSVGKSTGISNAGVLNVTNSTINTGIVGSGITNTTGTVTFGTGVSVTQDKVVNTGILNMALDGIIYGVLENSATANISASAITKDSTNTGVLNLNNGTLAFAVNGSGGRTNIVGDVSAAASINQPIYINSGAKLSTSASNLGGLTTNSSNLTLTGGVLSNTVSGSGATYITGNVGLNAPITQAINIQAGGALTTSADYIGADVVNNNALNLTGGTLLKNVSGNGNLNINSGTTTLASSVTDNNISLNGGVLKVGSNVNITGAKSLISDGGALSLQDNVISSKNLGDVELLKDMYLQIDADLKNKTADTFVLNSLRNDYNKNVIINSIKVIADIEQEPTIDINIADSSIRNLIKLSSDEMYADSVLDGKSYLVTYSNTNGNLTFGYGNLYTAIHTDAPQRVYNLSADENVSHALETMEGANSVLTVNGNSHKVIGNNYSAVTITSGQTLNVNNVSDWGIFSDSLIAQSGSNLNVKDSTFTADITNFGNMNLSGNTSLNNVSGDGSTIIENTENINLNGSFTQKSLIINSGNVNVKAEDLHISDGVTNKSQITLKGGILNSDIIGTGNTVISAATTNNSTINQNELTVNNAVRLTNNQSKTITVNQNYTNNGEIANNGNLVLNEAGNLGLISGTGSLKLSADAINDVSLTQGELTVDNGIVLANNSGKDVQITSTLNNNGTINNSGTITNSASGDIGLIAGEGTLILNGNTNTNNKGITQSTVVNSSNLTNTSVINGQINNTYDGTISSSLSNLNGNISNAGTLNITGGVTQGNITNYNSQNGKINLSNGMTAAHEISGNTINLSGGELNFIGNGDISNSELVASGGAINMQDNLITNENLGDVTLLEDLNILIDAKLDNKTADSISAKSLKNDNNKSIIISDINVISDPTGTTPFDITVADETLKNAVKLTQDKIKVSGIAEDMSYLVQYSKSSGNLNFGYGDLVAAVKSESDDKNYSIEIDEDVNKDLGIIHGTNATLTVNGNNHAVFGNNHAGIEVRSGQTLNLKDIAEWDGFSGNGIVNNETLNISSTSYDSTYKDPIKNVGEMTLTAGVERKISIDEEVNDNLAPVGITIVDGAGTIDFNDSFTQKELRITNGAVNIKSSDLHVSNEINNDAQLNLTGGELTSKITGTGATTIKSDTVNKVSIIQNNLEIAENVTLTNNSETITVNDTLTNEGEIVNGGEILVNNTANSGIISGDGRLVLNGDTTNSGVITQNNITNFGELNNQNAITGTIVNAPVGIISSDMSDLNGDISNAGTLNISGGVTQGNITNYNGQNGEINLSNGLTTTHEISDNTINLNDGELKFSDNGDISKSILVVNGGTVNLQDNKIEDETIGKIILNEDMKYAIDADLVEKTADKIHTSLPVEDNNYHIVINNIKIIKDPNTDMPTVVNVADENVKGLVKLSLNEENSVSGYDTRFNYLVAYENSDGNLILDYANLPTAVGLTATQRNYHMNSDEVITQDIGVMGGNNSTLTVNGNNHSVSGNNYEGVEVQAGQTLNLKDIKEWDGSSGNGIENNGTLNIIAVDANSTYNDSVKNTGEMNLRASAGKTITINEEVNDNLAPVGITNIAGSGTVDFNDNLTQNELRITNGTVNIKSSDVKVSNGVKNYAQLNLTGGELTSSITGTGVTSIKSDTTNNSSIAQYKLEISENTTLTNNASKTVTVDNTLTNNGEIVNNGDMTVNATNSLGKISGNGSLVLNGTMTNNAGIKQNSVSVTGSLVNEKKLEANVTNNGNSIITSNASNIQGNIVNNGQILFNGGMTGGDITGSGVTTINEGTVVLNHKIENNNIQIKEDTTLALRNGSDISNSTIEALGGTVDMINDVTEDYNLGTINLTRNNLQAGIDVDLENAKTDTLSGQVSAESLLTDNNIIISTINIITDGDDVPTDVLLTESATIREKILLADDVKILTGIEDSYMITYFNNSGILNFRYTDLAMAVKSSAPNKVYNMGKDEDVNTDLGILGGDKLTINGNNHSINGNSHDGITVGADKTLNINDVNTYKGFTTAVINQKDGTVNIKNTVFEGNNVAIDNNGSLNFSGNNNINDKITGNDGVTNFKDGKTYINDTITQKNINVSENSEIETFANLVKTLEELKNEGVITYNGGENTNKISGDGTININNHVSNSGEISQKNLIITQDNSTFTNDNQANIEILTNNGNLVNNKELTVNQLSNNNYIENNDNMLVTDNFENSDKFDNKSVLIAHNLDNSGVINNSDKMTLTGDINHNTNTIKGNGKLLNEGILDNNGVINQSNIDNSGVINTNSETLVAKNRIYNTGTINYNSGSRTVSNIDGAPPGNVNLNTNAPFIINNKISGTQLSLNNSTVYFTDKADISKVSSFNINGGKIDVMDTKLKSYDIGNVNLNSKSNLSLDFDINNETSDKFTAKINNNGGVFNVDKINVMGDRTLKDHITVDLGKTTGLGSDNVTSDTIKLPTIMTPIRRIEGKLENGVITYTPAGNSVNEFNPSVMASPVATQIGGLLSQMRTLDAGFYQMDRYSMYPKSQRMAAENANKYASLEPASQVDNSHIPEISHAIWTKPYATYEHVGLKGGVKVENFGYGNYFGGDSDLVDIGKGWKGVASGFIGYNGNHSNYDGISMDQQGGALGATGTLYKGNFFTGATVSVGASAGEAYTSYGTDRFAMITTGVASKSGYNWEIKNGKLIIQPSLFLGYSMVKTLDYKNSAGAKIDSDPLHAIQITPEIKAVGNLKYGWQPYASVGMVWNIPTGGKVEAADIKLPKLSVKPYVQYGVGVQKSWGEKFTAYGQVMMRNGGRNGIAATAGFRWAIGGKKTQSVNKQRSNIKNISNIQNIENNINKSKSPMVFTKETLNSSVKPQNI